MGKANMTDLEVAQMRMKGHLRDRIGAYMVMHNVTRAELARKMGVSRAAITQLLRCDNITIESLMTVAYHIGCEWRIELGIDRNRGE